MTASATNYVYLDPTGSCAPTFNTTGFPFNVVTIEFGGARMRGRILAKEQRSRTNAIWTSWRPRGVNLVFSHTWQRRTPTFCGLMVIMSLSRADADTVVSP